MDPKLKSYLQQKQAEQRRQFERERDNLLLSLGLDNLEKEYSPTGKKTGAYVHYDEEAKNYYRVTKRTPIVVTDEEYEQIKKYVKVEAPAPKPVDGTEWGLKIVNGLFWLVAIIGFICVINIAGGVLFEGESIYRGTENVWQQCAALQQETLFVSVMQLLAIGCFSIAMCFVIRILLKILRNQNEINAKMK